MYVNPQGRNPFSVPRMKVEKRVLFFSAALKRCLMRPVNRAIAGVARGIAHPLPKRAINTRTGPVPTDRAGNGSHEAVGQDSTRIVNQSRGHSAWGHAGNGHHQRAAHARAMEATGKSNNEGSPQHRYKTITFSM